MLKYPLFFILTIFIAPIARAEVNKHLAGVGYTSVCSGSFVAFEDYKAKHKGLYLTNGHCTQLHSANGYYLEPHQVVRNYSQKKSVSIFQASPGMLFGQKSVRVQATRLLFATMSARDIAVYELQMSYGEILARFGMKPLILKGSRDLESGDDVEVISGKWKKVYSCKFAGISSGIVKAGLYEWSDSHVLRQCDPKTRGGVSGAPVVLKGTRYITALYNSSVKGSNRPCSNYDACERDLNGKITSTNGDAFAQNIDFLLQCRNQDGVFDSTVNSCVL